jgi:hypothetical protein
MKKFILGIGTTLSLMVVSTAAMAQSNGLKAWLETVNKQIDASVVSPHGGEEGIATVSFRRGADGKPVEVTTFGTGNALAHAARLTAMRLRLPPFPAGIAANQRVTMKIIYGGYGGEPLYEKRHAAILAEAAASNQRVAARIPTVEVASRGAP